MYLYTNSKRVCRDVNDQKDEWERDFQTPRGIAIQWRKANAIHKWFVDNVQGGNDDCGIHEVRVEELVKLHDVCKEVLDSIELVIDGTEEFYDLREGQMVERPKKVVEDASVAKELLPTQEGFFFGKVDYDFWYWWDVQYTERKLAALLENLAPARKSEWNVVHKDEPDWYVKFYYQSSW